MTSRGLKKRPQLEDVIGEGFAVKPLERPWTHLADDPRVLAYSQLGNDPAAFRDLEWKLRAARRMHEDIRWAAMSRGGTVGAQMVGAGLGGGGKVPSDIVGDHDSRVEASIMGDEAARHEAIQRHQNNLAELHRMHAEAMADRKSKGAAEPLGQSIGEKAGAAFAGSALGGTVGSAVGAASGRAADVLGGTANSAVRATAWAPLAALGFEMDHPRRDET